MRFSGMLAGKTCRNSKRRSQAYCAIWADAGSTFLSGAADRYAPSHTLECSGGPAPAGPMAML